jgi:hypothetical protein
MSFSLQSVRLFQSASSLTPLLKTSLYGCPSYRAFSSVGGESESVFNQAWDWVKKYNESLRLVALIGGGIGLVIEAHRTLATKTEIKEVRTELKAEIGALGNKIDGLKDALLLTSMHQTAVYQRDKWAVEKETTS